LRGPLRDIRSNITKLKESEWINRQTRAVLVEFSIYNPNINMLAVFELLIEFLPTGHLITKSRIEPFILFDIKENNSYLIRQIFNVIYLICISIMIIKEIFNVFKYKLKYLTKFWNYVELLIIIVSACGLAIYLHKQERGERVLEFFRRTFGYDYYKLQDISLWNEVFGYSIAICAFLGTIKFLKFLTFNKIIGYLSATLKLSLNSLFSFMIIFFILWFAFIQLQYLLYSSFLLRYSTIIYSMTSGFLTILGSHFDTLEKILENPATRFIGPLVFIFYMVFIVFILLNVFVTIITENFSYLRSKDKKSKNDFELKYFLRDQLETYKEARNEYDSNAIDYTKYMDHVTYFPIKINELLEAISKVRLT
jgi:hypothetical protein